ncbi:hypothetical protein RHMOL_Rhmol13G0005000 [Rhododendron molle]|uniref:Uncharacterized protein n=1 Tax=Rhododendron molle TaxID=49168 RepID=A0ACC0L2D7_RHOML|nr:hypothetical protein RHMOL_Rhmol13G0005000 [Rhododendron molle]
MGTGKVFWSCRSLISRLFKEPASCNCIYLCILTAHLAVKKVLYVIILVFTFGKKKKLNSLTNLESFQLHVYTRTYALDQMVQAATSSAGLRTIKRVEQTLQDLGNVKTNSYSFILEVNLKPKVPTKAVCAEHLELRKEILTLLNLQKQLQNKEAEGSSYREGSYTETPSTPKRLQRGADQDRTFIPDPISFGGERVVKRDQKRKAPGRLSEAPSSPAQSNKRPQKLKASDG